MSVNPSSYVKVQVRIHDSVREDYRTMSHTSGLPMAILMRHAITSFLDNPHYALTLTAPSGAADVPADSDVVVDRSGEEVQTEGQIVDISSKSGTNAIKGIVTSTPTEGWSDEDFE
jgi:hypothetical protein